MFNNPFLYGNPSLLTKPGIFQSLKAIDWGTFLGNAQKTLGVINQAIPIVYQVKPIMQNAKTIFKIANSMKSPVTTDNVTQKVSNTISNNSILSNYDSSKPIFFL